jgi:competence protein ComEA
MDAATPPSPSNVAPAPVGPLPPPAPTPSPALATVMGVWPRSAQLALVFLLGVATTLIAVRCWSSGRWGARPTDLERGVLLTYRIDLNRATRAELLQLPSVGESLANRIDERRQRRPFQKVEELIEVPGIGLTTLERLRPWVCVHVEDSGDDDEPVAMVRKPSRPSEKASAAGMMNGGNARSPSKKEANLTAPVNINRASPEELQRLPGIGPKLAQRIFEQRLKAPFKSLDDLRRVPGIGPKTLDKIRPFIIVSTEPARAATPEI